MTITSKNAKNLKKGTIINHNCCCLIMIKKEYDSNYKWYEAAEIEITEDGEIQELENLFIKPEDLLKDTIE